MGPIETERCTNVVHGTGRHEPARWRLLRRDERRSVPISPGRARCRRHNRGAEKAIDVRRVAARAGSFHLPPPLLHCPSPRRRGQVQLSLRTRSHGGLLGSNCGRRRRRKSSLPRLSCWVVHLGHRERPRLSRFLVAIGCWDTVIDLLVLNFVFSEAWSMGSRGRHQGAPFLEGTLRECPCPCDFSSSSSEDLFRLVISFYLSIRKRKVDFFFVLFWLVFCNWEYNWFNREKCTKGHVI